MHTSIQTFITALCIAACTAMAPAMATDRDKNWEAQVRKADDTYWHDFNFGTSTALNAHLSADVEFYHDLGGTILGVEALSKVNAEMDASRNRGRRVLVPDTLRIFPMRRGPELYGAIVMGDHDFYSTESGKVVKKTVRSSFSHLMLLKDGVWKIARIYSYDHQRTDPSL